jgi:Tol biopolymer transport system component
VRAFASSADGKRLIVYDSIHAQFQLFLLEGGQPQAAPQFQKGDSPIDFTPDGAAVFVQRRGEQEAVEIWRVELASAKRTLIRTITLTEAPSIAGALRATISRDGKNFAYTYTRSISTEYVVEGLR